MHRYQRSTNATENRQAISTPLKLFRSNNIVSKQVYVQLSASADNVTLLALLLWSRRAAIDRYFLLAGRTAANMPQRRTTAK